MYNEMVYAVFSLEILIIPPINLTRLSPGDSMVVITLNAANRIAANASAGGSATCS
jgi:hypothetical protein